MVNPARTPFRLIIDEPRTGVLNMGIDRALIDSVSSEGSLPVLRIYSWSEPTVTIGYFQKVSETVNEKFCSINKIPVIRRITGGGTVLHQHELTYSFTVPVKSRIVSEAIDVSFKDIIDPVINTLKSYFINAEFKPVNDIIVEGRKISGSAQIRKKGILLQHGTILMNLDRDMFFKTLFFDQVKLSRRGITDPSEALTSVKEQCGLNSIDNSFISAFGDKLADQYRKAFNADFNHIPVTGEELAMSRKYCSDFFANDLWNYRR